MTIPRAVLILADGTRFEGAAFGHVGEASGVAVFYTGVVGYQEILTHPSYRGALVTMTYPIIGSCGVNGDDNESPGVQAAGLVVREASRMFSNFRATGSLEGLMARKQVVGIREVDTRALAVHLRERGEMAAAIVPADGDVGAAAERLRTAPPPDSAAMPAEVTWSGRRQPDGEAVRTLALLNLGVAESLLRQLADLGCAVEVLEAGASADDVLAVGADGVLVAGGPGDPRAMADQAETVRALVGQAPLLGVGLGHQVLALALGCTVEMMPTGHRGLNYPVRDHAGGRGAITVQHHRYVVAGDGVPKGVEVSHTNLGDGTVEGVRCTRARAWGIQWHPSRDEMQRPSPVLAAFCEGLA